MSRQRPVVIRTHRWRLFRSFNAGLRPILSGQSQYGQGQVPETNLGILKASFRMTPTLKRFAALFLDTIRTHPFIPGITPIDIVNVILATVGLYLQNFRGIPFTLPFYLYPVSYIIVALGGVHRSGFRICRRDYWQGESSHGNGQSAEKDDKSSLSHDLFHAPNTDSLSFELQMIFIMPRPSPLLPALNHFTLSKYKPPSGHSGIFCSGAVSRAGL